MKDKIIVLVVGLFLSTASMAQVTLESNNPINGNFLGFNNTSLIDLPLENNGVRTLYSFEIWPGYNSIPADSNSSRIHFPTNPLEIQNDIFSIIQVGDEINPAFQRQWMHVGTTYGAGGDLMYTGIIQDPANAGNQTGGDAVIAWGDNENGGIGQGPDNFRFLFISNLNPNNPGPGDDQGRETMRITPQGNVGIGNFSTGNGLAEQPTQRLDIDGGARLRQMPFNDTLDVFITGRQEDTLGDYVLTYTPIDDVSINDCRWEDVNSGTIGVSVKDLRTGFDTESDCYRGKVVIGAMEAKEAKLEAWGDWSKDKVVVGSYGSITGNDEAAGDILSGVLGVARGGDVSTIETTYIGIDGKAGYEYPGRINVGGRGEAKSLAGQFAIGLYGRAEGTGAKIGVYAEADTSTSGPAVGLYVVGGFTTTQQAITLSDENIKTNIQELSGASEVLLGLQPRIYEYNAQENAPYAFEDGIQYGFIAQEIQEILPSIVKQTLAPPAADSTGFVSGEGSELLGVQYEKLIPILVAGFQEQNALISDQAAMLTEQEEENQALEAQVAALSEQLEEQAAQMAEMQNQMTEVMASFQSTQSKMNNCCGTVPSEKAGSETGAIKLEQNFPNPFDEETTINFSLDKPAQIRLEISDSQGRVLEVLVNQSMDEGEYTERWDASAFAPGTYYYSLYADTELLTKKMIKK